jgi:hypothetical protein
MQAIGLDKGAPVAVQNSQGAMQVILAAELRTVI